MRTGRPKKPLALTMEQQEKLTEWSRRPKTAQRLGWRAHIVLGCASGLSNQAVAKQLRITGATVGADEPRPGAPRTIADAKVEEVVTRTLESTPRDATQWSTRSMAQAAGVSRATVHRIWQAFGLQPQRTEGFKLARNRGHMRRIDYSQCVRIIK